MKLCIGSPGQGWLPATIRSAGGAVGRLEPPPGLGREPVLHRVGMPGRDVEDLPGRAEQVADRDARARAAPAAAADRPPHRVVRARRRRAAGRRRRAEPLPVQRPQRRAVARPREDQLVAAAEPRLEVRQHRADQDPQVRLGHRAEDPNRHPLGRRPQVDIRRQVVHRRAEAAIRVHDRVPDPLTHRRGVHGVVTPDADADRDVRGAYARRVEPAQDDRQRLARPASSATGRRPRSPRSSPARPRPRSGRPLGRVERAGPARPGSRRSPPSGRARPRRPAARPGAAPAPARSRVAPGNGDRGPGSRCGRVHGHRVVHRRSSRSPAMRPRLRGGDHPAGPAQGPQTLNHHCPHAKPRWNAARLKDPRRVKGMGPSVRSSRL